MNDRVLIETKDDIAIVTLNHPNKFNALDMPMFEAIDDIGKQLSKNRGIKVVILKGEGKAFCSGLDVPQVMKDPRNITELLKKPNGRADNLVQRVSLIWRDLPQPVIAVTHGYCLGGGFQIALGADFRFTTADCQFSILESKWGLIPDMGATVLLRELIPIDLAKELTMSARKFNGDDALKMNLVTRVCQDPMLEALEFARLLCSKSPDAVVAAKRLYNESWLADERTALEWETKLQKILLLSWNQIAQLSKNLLPFSLPFLKRKKIWHKTPVD
jgi:enoyl-CoA hydratase/carnithine racemase